MLKVCLAGKPLRSLIKATSEHTLLFLSLEGWSIIPKEEEVTIKCAAPPSMCINWWCYGSTTLQGKWHRLLNIEREGKQVIG